MVTAVDMEGAALAVAGVIGAVTCSRDPSSDAVGEDIERVGNR